MTKQQALNYTRLIETLGNHGLSTRNVDTLLRAEKTLHTWAEHECNGAIQRDDTTGKPSWYNTDTGKRLYKTADREAGALRRIAAVLKNTSLELYHQTDPRGCALYLLRPGDVPKGKDTSAYYARGIAICI